MSPFQEMIYATESKNRTLVKTLHTTKDYITMHELHTACMQNKEASIFVHYLDDNTTNNMQYADAMDNHSHTPLKLIVLKSMFVSPGLIILTPLFREDFISKNINVISLDIENNYMNSARIIDIIAQSGKKLNKWQKSILFAEYIDDNVQWPCIDGIHKLYQIFNWIPNTILIEGVSYLTPNY